MSVVKPRRDAIDALEHAMQGVQTDDPRQIESRDRALGLIGTRSTSSARIVDDTPVEREVTVRIPRRPPRERLR